MNRAITICRVVTMWHRGQVRSIMSQLPSVCHYDAANCNKKGFAPFGHFITTKKDESVKLPVLAWVRSMCTVRRTRTPFQLWKFDMLSSFGCLVCERGHNMHVKVVPVDFQEHPEQKTVYVKLLNTADIKQGVVECFQEEGCVFVQREKGVWEEDIQCSTEIPVKFDIDMKLHKLSTATVEDLQNESIFIHLEDGECHLKNIKSGGINLITESGNIHTEGSLSGDAEIHTKSGEIRLHKIVCNTLDMTSDSGNMAIGSLYAEKSKFRTESGNISIVNGHQTIKAAVKQKGNVTIDTMDGSLDVTVNCGNVDVYLSRHEKVNIKVSSGDIILKVPEGSCTQLDLQGTSVQIDRKLCTDGVHRSQHGDHQSATGYLGATEPSTSGPTLTARTGDGSIVVKTQDWLESLKLKTALPGTTT